MEFKVARGEFKNWMSSMPYIFMGMLALIPLIYATDLTVSEYIRLGLITVGLAYLWWKKTSERMSVYLLALSFIFALIQFEPATSAEDIILWICGAFAVGAAGIYFFGHGIHRKKPIFSDWLALGIALVIVATSIGSSLLAEREIVWTTLSKIAISAIIWLLVTRSIPSRPEIARRFKVGILGIFAAVCLVGCVQVGAAYYYYKSGERAQKNGDLDAALYYYEHGAKLGKGLNFGNINEVCSFRMAGILFRQGRREESLKALALEKDFIALVRPEEWEGPEGGNLYYNTSCWKDLSLYKGEVEFRIIAHGSPAFDEWPLMRVRLGDEVLGDVFVTSREPQPYTFLVKNVQKTRKRLEISFLNDFHQDKPYIDRNLMVEQAEIQYRKIDWH